MIYLRYVGPTDMVQCFSGGYGTYNLDNSYLNGHNKQTFGSA